VSQSSLHVHTKKHIFDFSYVLKKITMLSFTPDLICKTLADSTRARIALLVAQEHELCVCELTWALDEIQPKISRHLALLREAGVLADRRQGQWIYYRLHPELPEWVKQMLQTMLAANKEWLNENHQRLCAMQDRPNRCC
jgi:ArsR family transcriptional regulator, arsenate/arsenite/antimonite-responsive transcriptional repressor